MCGRPAGWRVLADRARLGRPGSRLPPRASVAGLGDGHIVAAARLQLVMTAQCHTFNSHLPNVDTHWMNAVRRLVNLLNNRFMFTKYWGWGI